MNEPYPSAFPHDVVKAPLQNTVNPSAGMSLRDYFAAKAMQALITKNISGVDSYDDIAKYAFDYADSMLKQREEL